MLDERGVEWSSPSGLNSSFADSITFIGDVAVVSEIDGSDLLRINFDGTPEQAIEATLGRGTCMDVAEFRGFGTKTEFRCSECGYEYSAVGGFGCDYGDEPDFRFCPNCGRKVVDGG
jgi:hypothetical protein